MTQRAHRLRDTPVPDVPSANSGYVPQRECKCCRRQSRAPVRSPQASRRSIRWARMGLATHTRPEQADVGRSLFSKLSGCHRCPRERA
eukprot:6206350-Pleurochrysis_carterae.AAC.2